MRAFSLVLVALLAIGAVSCGEGDGAGDGGGSPTSPTGGGGSSSCNRPAAPANVIAAVTFNSVAFTWAAVSGANDYLITIALNQGTQSVLSTNTTQTSYNWNGVQRGSYNVRVEARNSCGSGVSSAMVTFTVN